MQAAFPNSQINVNKYWHCCILIRVTVSLENSDSKDEIVFFPFELDDVDYFQRIVAILSRHLMYTALTVAPLVGIADVSLGYEGKG